MILRTDRPRRGPIATATLAGALVLTLGLAPQPADAADETKFGMQAWPGVTVKTQVATQLLNAMGYESSINELGPQFVYQGMRSEDVDVTLGAWMPAHKSMLQPLMDDGHAEQYAINLEGAVQGLTVPSYVCDDGITTVAGLAENAERFDSKIYAIGSGAAMTEAFDNAVANDYKGLGDWEVVPSSTSGMLAQVERKTRKDEAIVFHGWKPHWMDVKFDICFLEDDASSEIANIESTVWTITRSGWTDANPEPAKFLKRFKVEPAVQSQWIYDYSYQEQAAETVAKTWIAGNLDQVAAWLEGVKAADGGSGIEAVRAAFSDG